MKLTNEIYSQFVRKSIKENTPKNDEKSTAVDEKPDTYTQEPVDIIELSFYTPPNKNDMGNTVGINAKANEAGNQSNSVKDMSGRLTKVLVAAKTKSEVQSVLSQAYDNMGEAIKAAVSGDKEAMEIVRKLQKLVRRANRKFKDLTNEEEISRKQKKAQKEQLEQLSKQLEEELKRKIAMRKQRENKYLNDPDVKNNNKNNKKQNNPLNISIAELESKIRMLDSMSKAVGSTTGASAAAAPAAGEVSGSPTGGEAVAAAAPEQDAPQSAE